MSIIGISGKKNSGKNTVADIIQYLSYCKSNGNTVIF
jgi:dephospho-CoA kinase